jgi:hypothetical protein
MQGVVKISCNQSKNFQERKGKNQSSAEEVKNNSYEYRNQSQQNKNNS